MKLKLVIASLLVFFAFAGSAQAAAYLSWGTAYRAATDDENYAVHHTRNANQQGPVECYRQSRTRFNCPVWIAGTTTVYAGFYSHFFCRWTDVVRATSSYEWKLTRIDEHCETWRDSSPEVAVTYGP